MLMDIDVELLSQSYLLESMEKWNPALMALKQVSLRLSRAKVFWYVGAAKTTPTYKLYFKTFAALVNKRVQR